MGIERRHHAVDRTLDELGIIGLFDIVGPDSLEHVAEQVQLGIGVGAGGGLGSRDPGLAPWSVHEKGEARTGYRAEEKDGILAHCSRTFSLSVAGHRPGRLRDPPTEWSRQFEALGLNRCKSALETNISAASAAKWEPQSRSAGM